MCAGFIDQLAIYNLICTPNHTIDVLNNILFLDYEITKLTLQPMMNYPFLPLDHDCCFQREGEKKHLVEFILHIKHILVKMWIYNNLNMRLQQNDLCNFAT